MNPAKKNEWILFWGSDDYPTNENCISVIRKEIETNKKKDLIIFKGRFVDRYNGKPKSINHFTKLNTTSLNQFQYRKLLFRGFRQAHQATLINPWRNLRFLRYDDGMKLAADLNFFLDSSKILNLCLKIVNLNIVDIGFGGISRRNNLQRFKEVIYAYWRNFRFFFFIPFILRYLKC